MYKKIEKLMKQKKYPLISSQKKPVLAKLPLVVGKLGGVNQKLISLKS